MSMNIDGLHVVPTACPECNGTCFAVSVRIYIEDGEVNTNDMTVCEEPDLTCIDCGHSITPTNGE